MTCPRCQQSNPVEARYCLGCGSRLALTCGSCGTDLPAGARFCLECGRAVAPAASAPARSPRPVTYTPRHVAERILTSRSALAGERKQVTVLFADLNSGLKEEYNKAAIAFRQGNPRAAAFYLGAMALHRGREPVWAQGPLRGAPQ